jgi:hypothetical protein
MSRPGTCTNHVSTKGLKACKGKKIGPNTSVPTRSGVEHECICGKFTPVSPFEQLMSTSALAGEVRRFLLTTVPSVSYLEAMLLLRAGASEAWSAEKVARRLYIQEPDAQQLLAELHGAGVAGIREFQEFEYSPVPEMAHMIDSLAQCYAENLMEVTDLIHSRGDRSGPYGSPMPSRRPAPTERSEG